MQYYILFNRTKRNEKRNERDFRLWINSEETMKTLDLFSDHVFKNEDYYIQENFKFFEFMMIYKALKNELYFENFSKGRYKKIRKKIKQIVVVKDKKEVEHFFEIVVIKSDRIALDDNRSFFDIIVKIFYEEDFKLSFRQLASNLRKDLNNYQKEYIDKTLKDMELYLLMNS